MNEGQSRRTESAAGGEQGPGLASRRSLGPPPRPGSRYSIIVGLAFLALVIVSLINTITTRNAGVLGLQRETSDLPLPEFAVPVAASNLMGDANIAQDDCKTSQLPCPPDQRRTPACQVAGADVIRVCDFFGRPLVLSFWFTRGGDCPAQQDAVSAVSQRYRGRVNFLSIDVRDSRSTVQQLIRQRGWRMAVGYDHDGAVSNIYRVGGCPTFAYAYPGGILEAASIGRLSVPQLEGRVNRLLRASALRARIDR